MSQLVRRSPAKEEPFHHLSTTFPPAFHNLSSGSNQRKSLQYSKITPNLFTFLKKISIGVFVRGIVAVEAGRIIDVQR